MTEPIIFIPVAIITGLAIILLAGILIGRCIAYGVSDEEREYELGRVRSRDGSPTTHPPSITSLELERARRKRDHTPAA